MNRNDMENGNEKWLNRLKDSLKDYREPAPPSVGRRLEKEWFAPAEKTISFSSAWKYAAAAAAVVLLFFSIRGIFGPAPEEIGVAAPGNNTPALMSGTKRPASPDNRPDVMAEQAKENSGPLALNNVKNIPAAEEKASGKNIEERTGKENGKAGPVSEAYTEKRHIIREEEEKTEPATHRPENINAGKEQVPAKSQKQIEGFEQKFMTDGTGKKAVAEGKVSERTLSAGSSDRLTGKGKKKEKNKNKNKKEKILTAEHTLYLDGKYGGSASGWQMGLAVANSGVSSKSSSAGGLLKSSSVMSSSSDFAPVPEGTRVVFLNGAPYLSNVKQSYTYKHKQPVSFGLYIGREVAPRLAVETGLNYTLLLSDVNTGSGAPLRQTLHFIGIPVRANWSFLQRSDLTLYLGGGGMLEKCVSGTLGHEKISMRELQYSVFAAPGIQYNLGGRFNIYFEPGIAYYFDNKSDIKTIRSDSPLNFTLQLGFRFAY